VSFSQGLDFVILFLEIVFESAFQSFEAGRAIPGDIGVSHMGYTVKNY